MNDAYPPIVDMSFVHKKNNGYRFVLNFENQQEVLAK